MAGVSSGFYEFLKLFVFTLIFRLALTFIATYVKTFSFSSIILPLNHSPIPLVDGKFLQVGLTKV